MPAATKNTHGGLAAALVAFQAEAPKVNKGKTATVPTKSGGQYRYTYADLADVTDAARPLLAKHGLSFSSQPRRCEDGSYELVGVLRHEGGESDEGALPLFGRTAQELGGSITYNRRYLLGCMTGIVTDDDVDAAHTGDERVTRQAPPPPPPADPLEVARNSAWHAFVAATEDVPHRDELRTREGFIGVYEQHTAQPWADATADDLRVFAECLTRGEVSL